MQSVDDRCEASIISMTYGMYKYAILVMEVLYMILGYLFSYWFNPAKSFVHVNGRALDFQRHMTWSFCVQLFEVAVCFADILMELLWGR